ncbi:MAG: PstS family phosphate ABC transporter substrate-binding protein [Elusimicrobia bacterium]|nr:PstS family phosphate ABC transporter substrate-binding protein [Elusimicrobiota bacterium]
MKMAMKAILVALMGASLWAQGGRVIRIDGSSTVYPITEAVAEEFQKKGGVNVTVGISGTGGGFKKFCRGEIDISNASRPIAGKEMTACREEGIQYYELPIAYDALTVVINPKNTWAATMTPAELKMIWEPAAQGKITKWSQVRKGWPDKDIKLYGPGSDSGTFDYFTEAIVGKSKASRGDYTASEDDNVLVHGVANDEGGLGYFGLAYYIENKDKVKAVAIDAGKGPVLPSSETVEKGSYNPLSRPIFIYVSKSASRKTEVKEFVKFFIDNAPELVAEVKYVALPKAAYEMAMQRFETGKVGSAFPGEAQVGISVQELLKRRPRS